MPSSTSVWELRGVAIRLPRPLFKQPPPTGSPQPMKSPGMCLHSHPAVAASSLPPFPLLLPTNGSS
ncbi:MAG: hypothetical protein Q8P67_17180 [archaeon]|nr:hypothetical protein [archaeon]